VGDARPAAGLVQGRAVPFARRQGPARRAGRLRRDAAEGDRDPGVGLDRRDAVPGAADAASRHRGLERGPPRRDRHPRLDDRHRPAEGFVEHDPEKWIPVSGKDHAPTKTYGAMTGVHDMGGMDGFGKVKPEPNEPVFHEPWEGRVMAMNRAM